MLQKFVEECLPWVECRTRAEEESKEIEIAETMCDKLPGLPVSLEDGKEIRTEVEPRNKPGLSGRFKIWFYFLLSYSDFIGNKFNFISPS